jgi:hypothetical protein
MKKSMDSDKSKKKTSNVKTVKTSKASKTKKEVLNIEVNDIRLSKDCRKRLKKVKDCMWGNVANAIEYGHWFIPVKNHRFTHIKKSLEKGMVKFFRLKGDDANVEVEDFFTSIIEYDNHRA